jgi:hypothetical protein
MRTLSRLVRVIRTHLMWTLRYNAIVLIVWSLVALGAIGAIFQGASLLVTLPILGASASLAVFTIPRLVKIRDHQEHLSQIRQVKRQVAERLLFLPRDGSEDLFELFLLDSEGSEKRRRELRLAFDEARRFAVRAYRIYADAERRMNGLKPLDRDHHEVFYMFHDLLDQIEKTRARLKTALDFYAKSSTLEIMSSGEVRKRPEAVNPFEGFAYAANDRREFERLLAEIRSVKWQVSEWGGKVGGTNRRKIRQLTRASKRKILSKKEVESLTASARFVHQDLYLRLSTGLSKRFGLGVEITRLRNS